MQGPAPQVPVVTEQLDRAIDNIFSLIEDRAAVEPQSVAIESPGRYPVTSAGVLRLVQRIVTMIRFFNFQQRDRIAVCLPNGPELGIVLLGVSSAAVCVPMNPGCRRGEYERSFRELGVKLLVCEADAEHEARRVALELGIPLMQLSLSCHPGDGRIAKYQGSVFSRSGVPPDAFTPPESESFDEEAFKRIMPLPPSPDDVAVVLHTTGTTSRPKVVALSHRNIMESTRRICESLELDSTDRCLAMLPQFHIGGLVDMLLAPIASGGSVVCTSGFDSDRFCTYVREFQPSWFQAVPTMLMELHNKARANGFPDVSPPLRFIRSVSSPLPTKLMDELEADLGLPVIEIYGMTEAAPLICSNPLPPGVRKPGSVGIPCGTEVAIIDENKAFLGSNQAGEVLIRGPNVFEGYEGDGDANAESFLDGWFRTGDLGYLDDEGYLFLRGRRKELINQGGEKISPFEIDTVLLEHPSVAQAITFPVAHRALGEMVAAIVVPRPGEELTEHEMLGFVRERVAEFKVPRHILVMDELPRGATGKPKRIGLAQELGLDWSAEYVEPRTPIEERLSRIWAEILDVPQVGVRDNFFDLGGYSVLGLALVDRVEQLMGRQMPDALLTELSTVESMAATLERELTAGAIADTGHNEGGLPDYAARAIRVAATSSRVPSLSPGSVFLGLNQAGEKPPLLWCFNHPDREMAQFARHLGPEQPVVGLYSGAGLFEDSQRMISATAQYYVERILELDSQGPVLLGGNCRGAAVVLEVALALRERGRTDIGLLVMEYFDSRCYEYPGPFTLLYGRQSAVQGYKQFFYGQIGWRERFTVVPNVVLIDGYHGSFWAKPFIQGFARAVTDFIQQLDTGAPSRLAKAGSGA